MLVKNIMFWLTTVCLVLAIALIAIPKLFGVEFRAVISGSMEPELPVGSLVVIVPTKAESIHIGDDIAFINPGDKVVTHRVVEIDREKNEFTTWGIANAPAAKDRPNRYENILGVVRWHAPHIGRAFSLISTASGKIIAVTAIVAAYIITFLIGIWVKKPKHENDPEESLEDILKNDDLLNALLADDALYIDLCKELACV